MNPIYPQHLVYLVDLEEPLVKMLTVLADHCDDECYSQKDLLMSALNFLMVEFNLSEAVEAMSIDVGTYCKIQQQPAYIRARIENAIKEFIQEMHRLFRLYHFYDQNGFLRFTFGGWHDQYVPIFIPYTHIAYYPQSVSAVVYGEPIDPHPSKIFHPYHPEKPEPVLPW